MNSGAPPTARKARTGLLTPPGITRAAASVRRLDSLMQELLGYEVATTGIPAERGHRVHDTADHRGDDVDGAGIGGLAAHDGLATVGFGEVGAGIDVGVVDHRDAE